MLPLIAHFDLAGRLPLLILYLILNLVAYPFLSKGRAQPPLLWHLFGNAGQEITRRLNKSSLPEKDLRLRGRFFIILMLALSAFIGAAVIQVGHYPFGWMLQLILLAGSVNALLPVALLRRDVVEKDADTIRRQDIMTAADHVARHVVAPIFFFATGGPLLLCIVVALLAIVDMKRMSIEGNTVFFYAPLRRLNRIIMIVPSFIAVILILLAGAFVSGGSMIRGLKILKTAKWHDSFGLMIAATAGVVNMTLGGPVVDASGDVFMRNWIGPSGSTAKIEERERNRAALLFMTCFILIIGMLSGVLIMKNLFS